MREERSIRILRLLTIISFIVSIFLVSLDTLSINHSNEDKSERVADEVISYPTVNDNFNEDVINDIDMHDSRSVQIRSNNYLLSQSSIYVSNLEMIETQDTEESEAEVNIPHYQYVSPDGVILELEYDLQDYTYELCNNYGIQNHYITILAQMCKESKYDSNLISSTNDYGLMQINQCNHNWLSKELGVTDFLDPYQNIKAGVYMMANNLNDNDISTALSEYNTGKSYSSTKYSRIVLEEFLPRMVLIED